MVWTEEALGFYKSQRFGYTTKAWRRPDEAIWLPPTDQHDEEMANNDAAVKDEEMGEPIDDGGQAEAEENELWNAMETDEAGHEASSGAASPAVSDSNRDWMPYQDWLVERERQEDLKELEAERRREEIRDARDRSFRPPVSRGASLKSKATYDSEATAPPSKKPRGPYNTLPIRPVAIVASQFQVRNSVAAKLCSAYEEATRMNEGRPWVPEAAVDPGKLLLARENMGKRLTQERLKDASQMEGLMLDEKKNKTLIQFFVETKAQQNTGEGKVEEDTASKVIREKAVQEIAPVIMFSWRHPKGVYIKTLNLETGDAPTLAKEAYEIIKERKSELADNEVCLH